MLEIGKRLSPSEAKAFTDEIKHRMYARWNESIFGGAFMRDLEAGKLPLETIRLFWKHWYSYPVEINNFHLIIYQRHQGIFARHRDLLAPYVGKISDELVNPSIPGHIQVLIKQGEAFGVTLDDMVNCEVFAECRALDGICPRFGLRRQHDRVVGAIAERRDVRPLGEALASSVT